MRFPQFYTSKIEEDVIPLVGELKDLNARLVLRDSTDIEVHKAKQKYIELQLAVQRLIQSERRMHVNIFLGFLTVAGTVIAALLAIYKFVP